MRLRFTSQFAAVALFGSLALVIGMGAGCGSGDTGTATSSEQSSTSAVASPIVSASPLEASASPTPEATRVPSVGDMQVVDGLDGKKAEVTLLNVRYPVEASDAAVTYKNLAEVQLLVKNVGPVDLTTFDGIGVSDSSLVDEDGAELDAEDTVSDFTQLHPGESDKIWFRYDLAGGEPSEFDFFLDVEGETAAWSVSPPSDSAKVAETPVLDEYTVGSVGDRIDVSDGQGLFLVGLKKMKDASGDYGALVGFQVSVENKDSEAHTLWGHALRAWGQYEQELHFDHVEGFTDYAMMRIPAGSARQGWVYFENLSKEPIKRLELDMTENGGLTGPDTPWQSDVTWDAER